MIRKDADAELSGANANANASITPATVHCPLASALGPGLGLSLRLRLRLRLKLKGEGEGEGEENGSVLMNRVSYITPHTAHCTLHTSQRPSRVIVYPAVKHWHLADQGTGAEHQIQPNTLRQARPGEVFRTSEQSPSKPTTSSCLRIASHHGRPHLPLLLAI